MEVAPNSLTELQRAKELLPNTILLDFNLEGNALDVCRRLRANRVLQAMPILMLCDYEDRDPRALGLSAGQMILSANLLMAWRTAFT